MSIITPLEETIKTAQDIETVLEEDYGATGKGLHEKATSVESDLPADCLRKIRYIATIRNKAVHDDLTVADEEIEGIRKASEELYKQFRKKNRRRSYRRPGRSSSKISTVLEIFRLIFKLFSRR